MAWCRELNGRPIVWRSGPRSMRTGTTPTDAALGPRMGDRPEILRLAGITGRANA